MTEDAWPSRAAEPVARAPLPRVEDLPVAEQGYDRDAVQGAFDAFYRHTAQLDATLRTLEAVDTFTRQAAELRADLRTLRAAGLGPPSSWSAPYSPPLSERVGISPAVPRMLVELVFVVAVPFIAGFVGHFDRNVILGVTLAAWALMLLIEYTAYRSRLAPTPLPRVAPTEPAAVIVDAPAEPAQTWDDVSESHVEALTMIAPPVEVEEAPADPLEPDAVEPEPVAIVEPPAPEPTFPAPAAPPTIEPPTPEPSIEPPSPEPTFPPTAPEPTFPPEPPAPDPEPMPQPEPPQPVAEAEAEAEAEDLQPRRRFGVFRRSRPAESDPVEDLQPAAESELEPALEAELAPEPEPEPELAPVLEAEPEAEAEPEPDVSEEVAPAAEDKPRRRFFGRRRESEADPEPLAEAEPVLEQEPEPVAAYVDPWERDFEYDAPQEPVPAPEPEPLLELEHEEPPPAETQERLAAERSEVEFDEPEQNGSEPVSANGARVAASRPAGYAPRRGRRR